MSIIAKRYSEALLALASEGQQLEAYQSQLELINDTLNQSSPALAFFDSPSVDKVVKKEVLTQTFKGKINKDLLNFLFLLIDKNRFSFFADINDVFKSASDELLGRVSGIVYSVRLLKPEEMDALSQKFSQKLNKVVSLENIVDESLMMGVRVEIGQHVYDGSLKKEIIDLEKQLLSKEGE